MSLAARGEKALFVFARGGGISPVVEPLDSVPRERRFEFPAKNTLDLDGDFLMGDTRRRESPCVGVSRLCAGSRRADRAAKRHQLRSCDARVAEIEVNRGPLSN